MFNLIVSFSIGTFFSGEGVEIISLSAVPTDWSSARDNDRQLLTFHVKIGMALKAFLPFIKSKYNSLLIWPGFKAMIFQY